MKRSFDLPDTVDLVVIGAGMCGVSIARHAAEAGKRVVLIDAGRIGSGMTGHSAGQVMTGFLPSPGEMIAALGHEETIRLQRWSHESKLALRRRWIDLGFGALISNGYLLVARSRDEREIIEGIASYWREHLNIDGVRIVVGKELGRWINSPNIDSALYDPSAFSIEPSALIEGLQRLAQHPQISLREHVQVQKVTNSEHLHQVETIDGILLARQVWVCIGARVGELVPDLSSAVTATQTLVAITEPIPDEILRSTFPGVGSGSDCSHHPDYWTVLRGNRLLFGCSTDQTAATPSERGAWFRHRLAASFPMLVEYAMHSPELAWVDSTSNGLPLLNETVSGVRVAAGLSGVGLAVGYGIGTRQLHAR